MRRRSGSSISQTDRGEEEEEQSANKRSTRVTFDEQIAWSRTIVVKVQVRVFDWRTLILSCLCVNLLSPSKTFDLHVISESDKDGGKAARCFPAHEAAESDCVNRSATAASAALRPSRAEPSPWGLQTCHRRRPNSCEICFPL